MANSDLVIDTDIIIDFLRRKSNTLVEALTHYRGHIAVITIFEIEVGAIRSERQEQLFNQILQEVTVLPLDFAAARQAAAIQRTLQQQGRKIGLPDTLIAGICLAQQMPLLTRNTEHFERVENLQLISSVDLSK